MNLSVDALSVAYRGRLAVDQVSWQLGEGFHALLGPNGAGKSSLLRAIVTLQPATGRVSLNGRTGLALRELLGYCPQENLGRSSFTVREHLTYMCWLRRMPKTDTNSEVDRVLDVVDLADRAQDKISTLSGGMRRRVGIGSALVGQPSLVVLDEPSAGLDMAQRESLARILERVARESILIVSTHIAEDVLYQAHTIALMSKGAFTFQGSFEDFAPGRDLAKVRSRYLELVES